MCPLLLTWGITLTTLCDHVILVSEMTYNVSSGTLNTTITYNTMWFIHSWFTASFCEVFFTSLNIDVDVVGKTLTVIYRQLQTLAEHNVRRSPDQPAVICILMTYVAADEQGSPWPGVQACYSCHSVYVPRDSRGQNVRLNYSWSNVLQTEHAAVSVT